MYSAFSHYVIVLCEWLCFSKIRARNSQLKLVWGLLKNCILLKMSLLVLNKHSQVMSQLIMCCKWWVIVRWVFESKLASWITIRTTPGPLSLAFNLVDQEIKNALASLVRQESDSLSTDLQSLDWKCFAFNYEKAS